MKNILVVNVNWAGDVIFSVPVFKALRKAYPDARIACLAVARVAGILTCVSAIDEIIIYDEKGRHRCPFGKLMLIAALRSRRFDAAFLLHRSLTRALFVFLAGIPQRIGYVTKSRGFFLTHTTGPLAGTVHRSDYYLNVVESFGIAADDRSCTLSVDDGSKVFVETLLRAKGAGSGSNVIAVNIGGNWDLKRWPLENFALLIDTLHERYGATVILPGARKDIIAAQHVSRMARYKPIIVAGETSMKQLIVVLAKVDAVISADSGPLHLAQGVGTPAIGIFGPTRPEVTGPRGAGPVAVVQHEVGCNHAPCYYVQCADNICMQAVTVEDVLDEVKKIKG